MNTATNTFFGTVLVPCTDKWGGFVPQEALKTFLKKAEAVERGDTATILRCNRTIKAKRWVRFTDRDAELFVKTYPDRFKFA